MLRKDQIDIVQAKSGTDGNTSINVVNNGYMVEYQIVSKATKASGIGLDSSLFESQYHF